jgi:signal transduction histidine kinase
VKWSRDAKQILQVGRDTTEVSEQIAQPLHAGDPGWSTFHVPVRLGDHLIGTFSTYRGRAEAFWPSERRALSRPADLAALAWTMEQYPQQRTQLARIDERERIADDLHDDVAQLLFSAQMSLDDALRSGVPNDDARSNILKARALLIRSDEALRNAIRQFSRDQGDDLAHRLTATVVDIERNFSVPIHLEIGDDVALRTAELSDAIQDVLVKVARESLANAAKHAGPCRASVSVHVEDARLVLAVSDDGIGMNRLESFQGHGLVALRRMVREHAAGLSTDSTPGGGTRVRVAVELPSAN